MMSVLKPLTHYLKLVMITATLLSLWSLVFMNLSAHAATNTSTCKIETRRVLSNTAIGGLTGGALGGLLGQNRTKGLVRGALIGGAGGAGYGYYKERQRTKDNGCQRSGLL